MTNAIVVGLLFLLSLSGAARAQERRFEMRPPDRVEGATPQVIGGEPAAASHWPATLRFTTPSSGPCTSTVIGPRVVLTAAHCVDNGATGKVIIGGQETDVTCTHHDGYDTDYRLDISLCLAEEAIELPRYDGVPSRYETLNHDPALPRVGNQVTLLGYGCRQAGGGGPSGSLFQGRSEVRRAASGDAYVETRGGAAVCFGDSGGGAFHGETRRLFAVNSRGDILTRSLLTSVAHPAVWQFILTWASAHDVKVCGIDDLPNCR